MKIDHKSRKRLCTSENARLAAAIVAAIAGLGLSACSTVTAKMDSDRVTREGIESTNLLRTVAGAPFSALAAFADAGSNLLKNAQHLESSGDQTDAAGAYLMAAAEAHNLLASSSVVAGSDAEKSLVDIYNSGLARFGELWANDPRRLEPGPSHLTSGSEALEIDMSKGSTFKKDYFDQLIAANAVAGKGVVHKTRAGCGAAMVGIREQRPERAEEMRFYPKLGLHVPVTLTIDSVTKKKGAAGVTAVKLSIRNPMLEQSVAVGGRRLPLAADFSAPIAVILKGQNEASQGLEGFFKADQRIKQSGIFLLEPYDPERIPVLLIHGLVSVPMIWRDIVPSMVSDPEISRRYQFMVFTYPSSYPLYQSAALLRENLAALRAKYDPDGNDPLSTNMVVAGHSMGGMLTHTLVVDIDDRFWRQISDAPFDQLQIDTEEKETIRKLVFFEADPAVRRAVYFSAPHRGAKMAQKGVAGFVANMAKLPGKVLLTPFAVVNSLAAQDLQLKIDLRKGKVTSVESLKPGAPMVTAMDSSPYHKGVIYHSVIGDRGKGDTPNSSDGVVEYWSSHQEGAASELIVPTDHGSYKHPRAIEELNRILREHAGIH